MEIKLHSNASTTPRTRKYIKHSDKSDAELASELSISIDTVKKWRNRSDVYDKSHRPNVIHRRLSAEQELLIVYLRSRLLLSLDELLEVSQLLINKDLSRAVLNRCLKKYQVPRVKKPSPTVFGEVMIDCIKLPHILSAKATHLLVITEAYTTHVSFALMGTEGEESVVRMADFLQHALPYGIRRAVITDNELVKDVVNQMGIEWSLMDASELIQIALESEADFEQPVSDYLAGEYFDARLGLPSILLCYEDLLNKRVLRNRLKNATPQGYCKTKKGS
ncbi:hypothetical protein LRP49_07620 [Enterovibrio sp. ZSDZ35]|uniref:Transposase n=1 Tax=Enterovibrio qingdaonensis TaxID=2899818 RepID=A0ABT5QJA0_9GAMM|nr:hypothetical protein [Enterovibrio sp. ZSDZ35]MDD1781070.1 hypothetical protein [Enterovibrio sp. ZSDZ35]